MTWLDFLISLAVVSGSFMLWAGYRSLKDGRP